MLALTPSTNANPVASPENRPPALALLGNNLLNFAFLLTVDLLKIKINE
jgi:hypothetical protein